MPSCLRQKYQGISSEQWHSLSSPSLKKCAKCAVGLLVAMSVANKPLKGVSGLGSARI